MSTQEQETATCLTKDEVIGKLKGVKRNDLISFTMITGSAHVKRPTTLAAAPRQTFVLACVFCAKDGRVTARDAQENTFSIPDQYVLKDNKTTRIVDISFRPPTKKEKEHEKQPPSVAGGGAAAFASPADGGAGSLELTAEEMLKFRAFQAMCRADKKNQDAARGNQDSKTGSQQDGTGTATASRIRARDCFADSDSDNSSDESDNGGARSGTSRKGTKKKNVSAPKNAKMSEIYAKVKQERENNMASGSNEFDRVERKLLERLGAGEEKDNTLWSQVFRVMQLEDGVRFVQLQPTFTSRVRFLDDDFVGIMFSPAFWLAVGIATGSTMGRPNLDNFVRRVCEELAEYVDGRQHHITATEESLRRIAQCTKEAVNEAQRLDISFANGIIVGDYTLGATNILMSTLKDAVKDNAEHIEMPMHCVMGTGVQAREALRHRTVPASIRRTHQRFAKENNSYVTVGKKQTHNPGFSRPQQRFQRKKQTRDFRNQRGGGSFPNKRNRRGGKKHRERQQAGGAKPPNPGNGAV